VPEQGFTSNELATPVGSEGRSLRRNAPTLLNVGLRSVLFHDGREDSLEHQVWGPLLERSEMGNASVDQVLQRVAAIPAYRELFIAACGKPDVSADSIGQALASYERTLLAGNSRFDRWFYAKDSSALSEQEQAGFTVFNWSGCGRCHSVGGQSALFTDDRFHNLGTGWAHSRRGGEAITLAPGLRAELDAADLARISEVEQPDDGRFEVTRDLEDRWAYRTPTLRNVALSAPYMHDGSLATLEQVIDYYDQGGNRAPDKDPFLKILNLTQQQKLALAAFLRSLTADNAENLAQKARASPLGGAAD
jgi:cytochrome c peroxidase